MDRFLNFIPFILKWETEYNRDGSVRTEHDPDDPGGATRYGIDARSHPGVDIESLTQAHAEEIYRAEWDQSGCGAMAPALGEVYFNARVNCGPDRAQKLLAAAGGSGAQFISAQAAFYNRLVAARPKSRKYLRGWLNRLEALKRWLKM